MRNTHQVQIKDPRSGEWVTLGGMLDVSRNFAEGYCEGRRESHPCPAMRIVKVQAERFMHKAEILEIVKDYDELTGLRLGMLPQSFGFQWPYIMRAVYESLIHAQIDARMDRDAPLTDMGIALEKVRQICERSNP